MSYSTFISRMIPYDIDGTVIKVMNATIGVTKTMSAIELTVMNDIGFNGVLVGGGRNETYVVVFFPELRDIKAIFATTSINGISGAYLNTIANLQCSADTTNGLDGTWTAVTVAAYPPAVNQLDSWRKSFKTISGCDGGKAIRFMAGADSWPAAVWNILYVLHLYGHKTAGQTLEDILFLDAENSDAEYLIPQDFGDRPAGTSIIHDFKVKNSHATETASTITLTVTDPDDIVRISEDEINWVTEIILDSLAANTKSATLYIKCETPVPPTPLGPKRARISATVGDWS